MLQKGEQASERAGCERRLFSHLARRKHSLHPLGSPVSTLRAGPLRRIV